MKNKRDIVECIILTMYQEAFRYRMRLVVNDMFDFSGNEEICKILLQEQCSLEKQYKDQIALLCIAIDMVENGLY